MNETISVALEDPPNAAAKDAVVQGLIAYNRSKTRSDHAEVQIIARNAPDSKAPVAHSEESR